MNFFKTTVFFLLLFFSSVINADFYGTHKEPISHIAIAPDTTWVAVALNINDDKQFPGRFEAVDLDYPLSRVVHVISLNKEYAYKDTRFVKQFSGDESVISLGWDYYSSTLYITTLVNKTIKHVYAAQAPHFDQLVDIPAGSLGRTHQFTNTRYSNKIAEENSEKGLWNLIGSTRSLHIKKRKYSPAHTDTTIYTKPAYSIANIHDKKFNGLFITHHGTNKTIDLTKHLISIDNIVSTTGD